MKKFIYSRKLLIIIIIVFFILGLLRINDLSLYTDCTRYLIWANSIAQGKGFVDDTQPIPDYFVVNAPLLSVLLTPPLILYPLSLYAAKIWILMWGAFSIVLFYFWLRKHFHEFKSLIVTSLFAFYPLTLIFSTEVLSEAPFLCGIFTAFIILEHEKKLNKIKWMKILLVLILSLIVLLREVGASLLLSFIIFLFIRNQRRVASIALFGSLILFGLWTYRNVGLNPDIAQSTNLIYIFQHLVTAPNTTIFNELIHRFILNFNHYYGGLSGMMIYFFPFNLIGNPTNITIFLTKVFYFLQKYIFLIFIPMLLAGIWTDIKISKTGHVRIIFLILYLLIILFYPVQDVRFIYPIIPFVFYYLAHSFSVIIKIWVPKKAKLIFSSFVILLILIPNLTSIYEIVKTNLQYILDYTNYTTQISKARSLPSHFSTPWQALGKLIEEKTAPGTIIVTPRKEIVAFAPKQKFIEVNNAVNLPQFETILRDYASDYIIAATIYDNITDYQIQMDEAKRFSFQLIANVGNLNLFKIESKLIRPTTNCINQIDTTNLSLPLHLFRLGRCYLNNENYTEALNIFNKLDKKYPRHSEIKIQLLIIYSFELNIEKAQKTSSQLYSSSRATSYSHLAQFFLKAMNYRLEAKDYIDPLARAGKLYEASKLYWQLGYLNQAYRVMREAIEQDSTFFMGLLWAYHFGATIGDTSNITHYMKILEQIDKDNAVVKSFRMINKYRIILSHTKNPQERSKLNLSISKEYYKIGMLEDALDEAQKAVEENPDNIEALNYLSELFEKNNRPFAVKKIKEKIKNVTIN